MNGTWFFGGGRSLRPWFISWCVLYRRWEAIVPLPREEFADRPLMKSLVRIPMAIPAWKEGKRERKEEERWCDLMWLRYVGAGERGRKMGDYAWIHNCIFENVICKANILHFIFFLINYAGISKRKREEKALNCNIVNCCHNFSARILFEGLLKNLSNVDRV